MQTAAKGARGGVGEFVSDVVRFPVWWYTTGAVHTATSLGQIARYYARTLGIAVWIRNLFVPMYGQYDWQSRVISLIVRSGQIFARGIALIVCTTVLFLVFALYLTLPLLAAVLFIFHVTGGFFGAV